MTKRRAYTLIGLLVVLWLIVGWLDKPQPTRQQQVLEAYNTCNAARLEPSGQSELECAEVLDKYGLVFTCNERNRSIDNTCWAYERQETSNVRYEL